MGVKRGKSECSTEVMEMLDMRKGGAQRARAEPGAAQVDASPLLPCIYPTGVIWFSVRRGNGLYFHPRSKPEAKERNTNRDKRGTERREKLIPLFALLSR